ncbi:uncharacterized mitochondrial protein AtMg00820-like [Aristolochia californica]|uniref:uncharacterized mitochondrial protein AtMg00820-like n=1 Tax=Aristolochia californica TaxID=171875 RepID=UPI0035DD7A50
MPSTSYQEALQHPGWKAAIDEEMKALNNKHIWSLVPLPTNKKLVGCKLVYNIKHNPNGTIARLKARLVAKGFYRCSVDHSIFVENTTRGKVILAVYVDGIILTGSDFEGNQKIKERICAEFKTKDLGLLK